MVSLKCGSHIRVGSLDVGIFLHFHTSPYQLREWYGGLTRSRLAPTAMGRERCSMWRPAQNLIGAPSICVCIHIHVYVCIPYICRYIYIYTHTDMWDLKEKGSTLGYFGFRPAEPAWASEPSCCC